jgi:predicted SAM-dependent methyltransferase
MFNIDIGGQKNRDGLADWKVVDVRPGADYIVNLNTEKLPFTDQSVDNIFTSHTIEHININQIPILISDMYRVLKIGGLIRVVVPDFTVAIDWYLHNPKKLMEIGISPMRPKCIPNTKMGWLTCWINSGKYGHTIGFDRELIITYLNNAKFKNIKEWTYSNSSKIFKGKDNKRYKEYSIYIEAEK